MTDYIDDVFGPDGLLSAEFPGYAPRPGQVALARAVDRAMASGEHLLAEAPTGVGKSVAYAVPASHHASRGGDRVLLVTANIALQEQLTRKDLPMLRKVLPWPFTYALLKGRSNYLCLERLANGAPGRLDPADRAQHVEVAAWAERTETGDKSELPFVPHDRVWSRFSVGADECAGDACEFYADCHANRAREAAWAADLVVTNYHMLFADLEIRSRTAGLACALPDYDHAVLDEGHKAAEIARDFFGQDVSEGAVRWAGGMLGADARAELQVAAQPFFADLLDHRRSPAYRARLRAPDAAAWRPLSDALRAAARAYEDLEEEAEDEKRRRRFAARRSRALALRRQLESAMTLSDSAHVYFIEEEKGQARLCSRPVEVAECLRRGLFAHTRSVSVTSATLTAGGTFDFLRRDLGAAEARELVAESPFDFPRQALIIVPPMPPPNAPGFSDAVAEALAQVIGLARGRVLGLFTSYRNLQAAHGAALRTGYRVLCQGEAPRTQLVDEFRRDVSSVLLGVESFWAGVDVPGEALSCVVIDRLPFQPPDDPVLDALQERDPQCFSNHSVPRAIIQFKQGFGRLIRSTSDRGVCVILDSRVSTKGYGRKFLESLPDCRVTTDLADVRRFLDGEELAPPPMPRVSAGGRSLLG